MGCCPMGCCPTRLDFRAGSAYRVGIGERDLFAGTPSPAPGPVRAEGVVEKILYTNEETSWKAVRVTLDSGVQLVAVGALPGIQPGEPVRLEGSWEVHPRHGRRLKVSGCTPLTPATLTGIEKYLGSGLVPGIGPEMAHRIVRRFGLDTLRVIEEEGRRLTEVEGVGPVRARRILDAWRENREIQGIMVFLQSYGVTTGQALRIWRRYGREAQTLIRADPYRLAGDIAGIGFRTADAIAANLGFARASPQRAAAGLLHVLGEMAESGHVFTPRGRLIGAARALLSADEPRAEVTGLEEALEGLARRGKVVVEEERVYLPALHAAETGAARDLAMMLRTDGRRVPLPPLRADLPREIAAFEAIGCAGGRLRLSPEQREAVERSAANRVLLISGGPGTGKTTVLRAVLQVFHRAGLRVRLAAPTGRAARRMEEAAGAPAVTIHRLLEVRPQDGTFARGAGNPIEADALVVDEVSMVDIVLFRALLAALPPGARLVLVGDADQLPSVGPGSVLHDLIASGRVPAVFLKRIFRQTEESRIPLNAHRIRDGLFPATEGDGGGGDFFFIRRGEPEEILRTVLHLVTARIPQRFGLDPREDVQVLTPMHKGVIGSTRLNAELQGALNPRGETVPLGRRALRLGDRVMQVRNDYEREVFNGDVGRVAAADTEGRWLEVRYDERAVRYDAEGAEALVLAYACSIHKSQGSEYPAVVVPLHTQHAVLLRRNLLYTAVTRGRRLVVLVGSTRALALALREARGEERCSHLAARLCDLLPP